MRTLILRISSDNSTRKELIAPLTNYNVLSLSQQFLNDFSSISFLNTNVNRKSGFNANNAALVLDLFDNKRKFNFQSNFFTSHSPRFSQKNGVRGAIQIQELKGNVNFKFNWDGVDKYYNQNELGFSIIATFNLSGLQLLIKYLRNTKS